MLREIVRRLRDLAAPEGDSPDGELLRRFAADRDAAAFEALVARHGPMVFNTCRRVLGASPDAEDAFQATFLVLARRAASVRRGEALGGWLHRVAHRAAVRARDAARRAAKREGHPLPDFLAAPGTDPPDDLGRVLEEEIARLPEKLRVAFVLCHLQGQTNEQAAASLGCPKGTVLSRLSRARERLRDRLTRRGLGEVAALTALALPQSALPSGLAARPAFVPDRVHSLADGVLRAMTTDKLKIASALVLAAGFAAFAGVLAASHRLPHPDGRGFRADPARKEAPPPRPLPVADKGQTIVDEVRFSPDGRVLLTAGGRPDDNGLVDTALLAWDAATGKLLHSASEPAGVGAAFDFAPDGKSLVTANVTDNSVSLWNVADWKGKVLGPHPLVSDVAIAPGGAAVASRSCAFAGTRVMSDVIVWDAAKGRRRFRVKRQRAEAFHAMAFSPDGATLGVGTNAGRVRLFDAETGKERAALAAGKGVAGVAFAAGGKVTATWCDGGVKLWDAAGQVLPALPGADGPAKSAAFSPDGKLLAAADAEGGVRVWDVGSRAEPAKFRLSETGAEVELAVQFSPDGGAVAVVGWVRDGESVRGLAKVFASRDGKALLTLERAKGVAFVPGGKGVAVITGDPNGTPSRAADEVTIRAIPPDEPE